MQREAFHSQPDRPFYVYFATGALHAPHHVPKEYIDKYRRQVRPSWTNCVRKRLPGKSRGNHPQSAQLTPRPKKSPPGITNSRPEKIGARQMETFAAFAEHTDHEVGRLVQALEEMGAMDNTLVIYNRWRYGASAEADPKAPTTR